MLTTKGVGRGLAAEAMSDELRKMILSGALGVGVRQKQEALAKRSGGSRFVVREALWRLPAEGLATHTPNAGPVVASRTAADLVKICDIRIGLEPRALELAIPSMRPTDIGAAKATLTRYDVSELPQILAARASRRTSRRRGSCCRSTWGPRNRLFSQSTILQCHRRVVETSANDG